MASIFYKNPQNSNKQNYAKFVNSMDEEYLKVCDQPLSLEKQAENLALQIS